MRRFVVCTLLAVSTLAEPPVNNRYLPPQQDFGGGFSPPSQSYGAPSGSTRQTDAVFGGRPSSTYGTPSDSRSNLRRPSNQYRPPQQPSSQYGTPQQVSNQYLPPQSRNQPSNQYGPPPQFARQPSSQYGAPSQFRQPSNQYGPPNQARSQPSKQYGPPNQARSQPSNQYGPPNQARSQPSNQYGPPNQARSQPSNQYGPPNQNGLSRQPSNEYGTPSQGARQPSSQYGTPGFGPSQQFGAPIGGEQYSQGGNYEDAQSRQYLPPGAGRGYKDDGSNGEPANYSFEYMVKDDASGNDFGHRESRMGDRAEGRYYVLLPDGRKQTVEYEADQNGYQPRISYEDTVAGGYDGDSRNYAGQDGDYNQNGGY